MIGRRRGLAFVSLPFAYFSRLSPRAQKTYLASDGIREVLLPPAAESLRGVVDVLRQALEVDDHGAVQAASEALVLGLTRSLGVPSVVVQVLAVRPARGGSELHGLYTSEPGRPPRIRVWMRTARLSKVVAFKTFLRTLLHEFLHHLDFAHFRFRDSFHTQGFYARESSLVRQLL